MRNRTEFLLYSAARAQHIDEWIMPYLKGGYVVISDRFYDSSYAYQGEARGLNLQDLTQITQFATNGLVPNLTILLDLDVKIGLSRAYKRGEIDRLESETIEFHRRVRNGFLKQAQLHRDRIEIIYDKDLEKRANIKRKHHEIIDIINHRFGYHLEYRDDLIN